MMGLGIQYAERAIGIVPGKRDRHADVGADVECLTRCDQTDAWIRGGSFDDKRLDRARDVLSEGIVKRKGRSRSNATPAAIVVRDDGQLVLHEAG